MIEGHIVGRFFTDIGEKFVGSSQKPTDIGRFFSRRVQNLPISVKKRSSEISKEFRCFFLIRSNLDSS